MTHYECSCKKCKPFEVRFTLVVDYPEKRGPSYQPVAPGTAVPSVWTCKTHKEAVGYFNGMLAGEWDFSSEYITKVEVLKMQENASPKYVRKTRKRAERCETFKAG